MVHIIDCCIKDALEGSWEGGDPAPGARVLFHAGSGMEILHYRD